MKDLICKKILGTATATSATVYQIGLAAMPLGTRLVMISCDQEMTITLPNSSDTAPTIPAGTIAFLDANDDVNVSSGSTFNNLSVVFLG